MSRNNSTRGDGKLSSLPREVWLPVLVRFVDGLGGPHNIGTDEQDLDTLNNLLNAVEPDNVSFGLLKRMNREPLQQQVYNWKRSPTPWEDIRKRHLPSVHPHVHPATPAPGLSISNCHFDSGSHVGTVDNTVDRSNDNRVYNIDRRRGYFPAPPGAIQQPQQQPPVAFSGETFGAPSGSYNHHGAPSGEQQRAAEENNKPFAKKLQDEFDQDKSNMETNQDDAHAAADDNMPIAPKRPAVDLGGTVSSRTVSPSLLRENNGVHSQQQNAAGITLSFPLEGSDQRADLREVISITIPCWTRQLDKGKVTAVDFSNRSLMAEAAKVIGLFLNENIHGTVEEAIFSYILDHSKDDDESRQVMASLCNGLAGAPNLRVVDLSHLPLHKCAQEIALFLKNGTKHLHELSLADSGLSDDALRLLELPLAAHAPTLRKFELTRLTLGEDGFKVLRRLIPMMTSLEHLNVSGLRAKDLDSSEGGTFLVVGLVSLTLATGGVSKLRSVNLADAKLEDGSAASHPVHLFAWVCAHAPYLQSLYLNETGVGTTGLENIYKALGKSGAQLSQLGLEGLELEEDGARVLVPFAKTQKNLRKLHLGDCSLGDRGLEELLPYFAAPECVLNELCMDSNGLDDERSANLLAENKIDSLEVLSITDNELGGVDGLRRVKSAYPFATTDNPYNNRFKVHVQEGDEGVPKIYGPSSVTLDVENVCLCLGFNEPKIQLDRAMTLVGPTEDEKEFEELLLSSNDGGTQYKFRTRKKYNCASVLKKTIMEALPKAPPLGLETKQAPAATNPTPVEPAKTNPLAESNQQPALMDMAPARVMQDDENSSHLSQATGLCVMLVEKTMKDGKRVDLFKDMVNGMDNSEIADVAHLVGGESLKRKVDDETTSAGRKDVLFCAVGEENQKLCSVLPKILAPKWSALYEASGAWEVPDDVYDAINRDMAYKVLNKKNFTRKANIVPELVKQYFC